MKGIKNCLKKLFTVIISFWTRLTTKCENKAMRKCVEVPGYGRAGRGSGSIFRAWSAGEWGRRWMQPPVPVKSIWEAGEHHRTGYGLLAVSCRRPDLILHGPVGCRHGPAPFAPPDEECSHMADGRTDAVCMVRNKISKKYI